MGVMWKKGYEFRVTERTKSKKPKGRSRAKKIWCCFNFLLTKERNLIVIASELLILVNVERVWYILIIGEFNC